MENLKALVYGKDLTDYQKALAIKEFEKLQERVKYLEEREDILSKLEAAGVDNWCGYEEAFKD